MRANPSLPIRFLALSLLCAPCILLPMRAIAQTGELIILKETGPRDQRVNMVIIGDGYTASDKEKFKSHMQTVADAVVKDYPLWDYTDYFNIYGIFVPSKEAGADQGAQGIYKDTYFGAAYDPTIQRLLVIDNAKGFAIINKFVPESDMQFAIVNSDVYGGSGGQIAVANYASPEIIAHEAQHSFTGLGDEYDYAGSTMPWEAPNTTARGTRTTVPWGYWILPSTPVPTPATTPYAKLPGVFEGAAYNTKGWFRPKETCRMRENGLPFCEVCMEAIILAMYRKVSPLDSVYPPRGTAVKVAANTAAPLRVKIKKPIFHDLSVAWIVDGLVQPDAQGPAFTKILPPGSHRVIAKVSDTTHMVRQDPDGLMVDTASWQVTVSNVAAAAPQDADGRGVPVLVAADGKGFWTRFSGTGSAHIRLTAADGTVAEDRTLTEAFPGSGRIAWNRILAPGWYLAELEQGGRTSRRYFAVPP